MNPTVSLRAARRRGYFMAVSLAELRCEPSQFASTIAPLTSAVWRHGGEVELIERCLLLATFGCYEAVDDAADRAVLCAIAISDELTSTGSCFTIAIDCGWFETSAFTCLLPSGLVMRRAVISSIARDVAVKLGPLGNALKERLMITGEALRSVHPKSLNGRVPIICDHLKFDSRNWSKAPRRGSVFIFVIPVKTFGTNELVHHQAGEDNPKNDTRAIAEGFQLMVSAQYIEAEFHFKRLQADRWSTARGVRQTISRMLAITSAISNVMRLAPGTVMAPYYRGECPAFETTIEEQVAFRLKQSEVSLPRNFMNAVEDPSSATNIAEVLDSTHRQSGGVSHRRKAKEWRKKARR